jgi:geranylgeranyl pyrophosphate synthase
MRQQANDYHPDVIAALNHLLLSGGKRMRPAVTLLIGTLLNGERNRLITLAAAIELLHTATLVHDDLIDGSLLRRGIPTLNAQWSPAATVLTGDFLFSRAAKLAAEAESLPVMKNFANTLTIIVNGEITQLFASRCQVDLSNYTSRIYAKTASLFETAASSAAIIANATPTITEQARIYGYNIGMAFQIVDDILDFTSDPISLGKPVGNDLRQGLVTLPALLYIQSNPNDPNGQDLLAGKCIKDEQQIHNLIEHIISSTAIEQSYVIAHHHVDAAIEALHTLPAKPERTELENLARYITNREH